MPDVKEYATIEVVFDAEGITAIIKFPQGNPREALFSYRNRNGDVTEVPFRVMEGARAAFVDRYADILA